jgi:hypothetical protein
MPVFISIGLFLPLLAGCATDIRLHYQPTAPAQSLSGGRMPKIFLQNINDRTGGIRNSIPHDAEFNPPIDEALRTELAAELTRMGIILVQARERADAVINAAVTEASLGQVVHLSKINYTAGLGLTLQVNDLRGKRLWDTELKGSSRQEVRVGIVINNMRSVMNAAWADVLGQIRPVFESEGVIAKIFGWRTPRPVAEGPASEPGPSKAPALATVSDVDDVGRLRAAPRLKAYAVVIGIGRYRQKLPAADFADVDARLVSKYVTQAMGYQDANVATLINDEATKSDFEKYLEQWLPNRVEKDAEVFVYFSGHGAPNPATGDAYLVPYDGDPTYLKQTAYPLKSLFGALAKLPTNNVTVVLDSCFSGAGGRSVVAKGSRPLVNVALGGDLPSNIRVLSASAGDQISHSYDEKGHGLFTYFLLRGIKEQIGRSPLDLRKVFNSAATEVSNIARREYNSDQVPQWQGEGK